MRAEADVPIEERYLPLYTRVSAQRFNVERAAALLWCRDHSERLSPAQISALEDLRTLDSLPNYSAVFIQHSAYADIEPHRSYSAAFNLVTPSIGDLCIATLRFSIHWRRLPMRGLGHGHHHLVVFDFPNGIPAVLDALPVDLFDGGVTKYKLALADVETWQAHQARLCSLPKEQ